MESGPRSTGHATGTVSWSRVMDHGMDSAWMQMPEYCKSATLVGAIGTMHYALLQHSKPKWDLGIGIGQSSRPPSPWLDSPISKLRILQYLVTPRSGMQSCPSLTCLILRRRPPTWSCGRPWARPRPSWTPPASQWVRRDSPIRDPKAANSPKIANFSAYDFGSFCSSHQKIELKKSFLLLLLIFGRAALNLGPAHWSEAANQKPTTET